MKFLGTDFSLEESNAVVFGVPLGKGSIKSLESIRRVSSFVEPMDLDYDVNLLEKVKTFDKGNIELDSLDKITEEIKNILNMKKIPLMLGGNHLSSYYSVRAFKKVKLIVFDAHGDFKNSYDDEKIRAMNEGVEFNPKFCDATWLRRISEIIQPENIMLIGVRSCDEFEFNFMKNSGIQFFTSRHMLENPEEVYNAIEHFTKSSDVYVSLDFDVFDPSVAPAVEMPESDGIFFNNFQNAVKSIGGKIVGMDLCCLNSMEGNEISEFLATRSMMEVLYQANI
ncbi:MAG: arginase family protein [Candidatus Aenigmarchaeota archaeon]|nr:arginase family protein [Candidatus Aenigmarchaeota archaeon]